MPRYDSLESTFSIILLSLELKETKKRKILAASHPYSFTIQQAYKSMLQLNYRLDYGPHFADVCISMPEESMRSLLQKFLDAHLIHCPDERSTSTIGGSNTTLQPTAKGVAVIQEFCRNFAVKHAYNDTLFKSPLNTMELLHVPHEHVGNHVEISESMLMVLWNRMLGATPHPYCDKMKRDRSPYWHQWLLHPHGNSLSQYYTSDGIRLFKDVTFKSEKTKREYQIDYVLSGRVIYQWLMDCTNIMSPSAAQRIARMFVGREYLRRVDDPLQDEITAFDEFPKDISRTTIYRIAHRGHLMCRWCDELTLDPEMIPAPHWETITTCNLAPIESLDDIFADSGLKMLFSHAITRLHASENLEFLYDLEEFNARYTAILNSSDHKAPIMSSWQHIASIVYRYVNVNSVKEINIPLRIRKNILAEIPEGRITYTQMQSRIDAVHSYLKHAEQSARDLLTAMIPEFKKDPIFERLPLIAKAINPTQRITHVPFQYSSKNSL